MFVRFAIGISLLVALCAAPLRGAVSPCAMSMPAPQKIQCDCCATMKSCVLPRENPTQPRAAAAVSAVPLAMIAPGAPVLLREVQPTAVAPLRELRRPLAVAAPRFALFCAFLI